MTDKEPQFREVIESLFSFRGIRAEPIPTANYRTPDYRLIFPIEEMLLELKIKEDHPEDITTSNSVLDAGGIASRSRPLRYMNNASGVISDGVKQMLEFDPVRKMHHVLWLHASGHDSYAYEEQLRFTLYGTQRLFSSERSELIHCFFFNNSEFWRHRSSLAAAFVSKWTAPGQIGVTLCLNPYYSRKSELDKSSLRLAFSDGLLDVKDEVDDHQVLLMDGNCDRKDSVAVLDYLRAKYNLGDLQPFDLGYHVAGMLVRDSEDA